MKPLASIAQKRPGQGAGSLACPIPVEEPALPTRILAQEASVGLWATELGGSYLCCVRPRASADLTQQ